eukprot:m.320312 g.320312  ORF g.320312 m.320312 type:complete len:65 (-) comp55509_c0_seq9:1300-1494(-)
MRWEGKIGDVRLLHREALSRDLTAEPFVPISEKQKHSRSAPTSDAIMSKENAQLSRVSECKTRF